MSAYFAKNVAFLLNEIGIRQNALSNKINLSENTLSRWVHGKSKNPQRNHLIRFCNYFNQQLNLNLSIEQILGEDVSKIVGGIMESGSIEAEPPITPGFREFMEDQKLRKLMNVSDEEIEALKTIRFIGHKYPPTKKFYIDALFRYREDRE